jgi:rRNA maturation protein Nop10
VSEVYGGRLAGAVKTPAGTSEINSLTSEARDSAFSAARRTCEDTAWVTVAKCQNETDKYFAKRIYCGKEWCPVCGQKRSRAHNRRIARVLPKAMQIQDMGYFVCEFPDAYRKRVDMAYSKAGLRASTNKIVDVLAGKRGRGGKRQGGYFSRGLIRWHYFGDKIEGKWNPHINVLVDSAFIEGERLEEIKAALREALDCPEMIIHYTFAKTPGEKFHHVSYITRATFLNYDWNPYMAEQLYNFRNSRWWGSWKGEAVWQADANETADLLDAETLDGGHCPDCGGELVWTKPVNAAYLYQWQAVEIGETGFYRIPQKQFEGHVLRPAEVMRVDSLRLMRVGYKNTIWTETLDYIDSFEDIEGEEIPGEFIGREIQGEIYLN